MCAQEVAFKKLSDDLQQNRRLVRIGLSVSGGEWLIGPHASPFARLYMESLEYSLQLDASLGVPVQYLFRLRHFCLDSLRDDGSQVRREGPWGA